MKIKLDNLKKDEQISLKLEAVYEKFGYRKFKMRSFEEYSMYLSYSDFLLSKNIITFSGLDGKLLALRPDVTLSIIKNTKASKTNTEKLFYNEKVYREFSKEYKEINQTGVELIGNINLYSYAEITTLALKSLECIGSDYVLDISDMAVVGAIIDEIEPSDSEKAVLYEFLKAKNIDDFLAYATKKEISEEKINAFCALIKVSGGEKEFDAFVKDIAISEKISTALDNFKAVLSVLSKQDGGDKINVNFSIYGNADYYNGLIFNGYVQGVPKAVLSGGRYDKLLQKFGKEVGAIGFAVYLGEIERYLENDVPSTDILVLFKEDANIEELIKAVNDLILKGYSVRVDTAIPEDFKFLKLFVFDNGCLVEKKND